MGTTKCPQFHLNETALVEKEVKGGMGATSRPSFI